MSIAPYELRISEKGTYELWLKQGGMLIRLTDNKEIIVKQNPDLKDGYAEVTITVLAGIVKEQKLRKVGLFRAFNPGDAYYVLDLSLLKGGVTIFDGTLQECEEYINKDPNLVCVTSEAGI